MEDELKEACRRFVQGHTALGRFKAELRDLLSDATEDQMLEFAHIVIEGLSDERH